jgi:peptide/nickel transport system permease protein
MTDTTETFDLTPQKGSNFRRELGRAGRSMVAAKWPLVALVILLTVLFVAIFGPTISPLDPNRQNIMMRLAEPMADGPGGATFLMGSDALGRDVFARLLYGARVSLMVGVAAILVGGTLGVTAGLVSGYFGGWIDDVLMRLGDIQLAFPFILLAIMFLVVLGPGLFNLIVVLGHRPMGDLCPYRAGADAVLARKGIRRGRPRHGRQHRLDHIPHHPAQHHRAPDRHRVVQRGLGHSGRSVLSFLGLGVPPEVPTWGSMLAQSRDQLIANKWWLAIFPAWPSS